MAVTINGVSYDLPTDDGVFTKVPSYNAAIIALASALSSGNAWSSWTPTWTNLTVGNGTVVAKYLRIGSVVICRLSVVFGSTTSISGAVDFTLPVTAAAHAGAQYTPTLGTSQCFDASAVINYAGNIVFSSTTKGLLGVFDAGSAYLKTVGTSSTIPFTWTTSDQIGAQFSYEAA